MKKNNNLLKRFSKFQLVLVLLATLASCGKNKSTKNEVADTNTSTWNNNGRYNTPVYQNPNVSSAVSGQISQITSSMGCAQGSDGVNTYTGRRLSQNITFSAQGQEMDGNSSTLDFIGGLNPGPINGGGNEELYVGMSVFGDLLFITKYSSGFNVIGYNYTISFCEAQIVDQYSGYSMPAISDQNQVVQLTNDSTTVLDFQSYQGVGMVDKADLTAYFSVNNSQGNYQNSQYGQYGSTLPFVTTFFPLQ